MTPNRTTKKSKLERKGSAAEVVGWRTSEAGKGFPSIGGPLKDHPELAWDHPGMEYPVAVWGYPCDSLDTCAVFQLAVFQTLLKVWSCTLLAEGDSPVGIQILVQQ